MTKVTLDMNTFKALASDTRLDILKALDGARMNLNDISKKTKLNKATLHEHLVKLNEAGLVKRKEREGHKWVYYKLTWKGESLLHPENTRIVVMFSVTFISILVAVMFMVSFAQPLVIGIAETEGDTTYLYEVDDNAERRILFEMSSDFDSLHIYSGEKGFGDYEYIGAINATDQTVEDITEYFQMNAAPTNTLGQTYAEDDIQWYTTSNMKVAPSQSVLYKSRAVPYSDENKSDNETGTNDSPDGAGWSFGGYTPAVSEMIAVVQDSTLLYLAIACISFSVVLFSFSTWRLIKNKKQKF